MRARAKVRWIPKDSTELLAPEADAVVYFYVTAGGALTAIGYHGKATNPDFHVSFRSEKSRLDYVNNWRVNLFNTLRVKQERKAQAKSGHNVQVGDIFNFAWGYDQTNQDFYQVIDTTKCTVTIQEIASRIIEGDHWGGRVMPIVGKFLNDKPPEVKRVQFHEGKPYLNIASYGWCDLWDGQPACISGCH